MREMDAMAAERELLDQLAHIMKFQLNDLRKASILATANFLVAVGSMNTIEFLGGVRNGKLGQKGQVGCRFKEGVRLLGGEYLEFGEDRMYTLRNGLTHQYVPELPSIAHIDVTNDWNTDKAVITEGNKVTLNVARLVVDLGAAWGRLQTELEQSKDMRSNVTNAMKCLPKLR